jgi:hypothetical protein
MHNGTDTMEIKKYIALANINSIFIGKHMDLNWSIPILKLYSTK